MPYILREVTIRANNSPEGLARIDALWQDIASGKLPLLFDSAHTFQPGISPVSRYSNYESDENGDYDLSILGVTAGFFQDLEAAVQAGRYAKYETSGSDLSACAQEAWSQVWADRQSGTLRRAFTEDYESTVPPEYTKDGTAHCYLYIACKA